VPHALEQSVDNLIDNAFAVAPQGTAIEIAVHVVPAVEEGTGDRSGHSGRRWVEVHVLDRGPGMSDEQLRHATDRFWRAADADHGGSGLGLAIVEHLVRASGGTLVLARRAGGGLDAGVRFPCS